MLMSLFVVLLFASINELLGNNLSVSELNILRTLYFSCNGPNWNYTMGVVEGGVSPGSAWDFNSVVVNPCADNWQGVTCNSNCNSSIVCFIAVLNVGGPILYNGARQLC